MSKKSKQKKTPKQQTEAVPIPGKAGRLRIDEKYVFYALVILLIVLLIPMLLIARYDAPSADDFSYGALARHAWVNTHSLRQVLLAAAQQVKSSYTTWQGSFFALFLFALQPAIFGEKLYVLTPFIMLLSLCGGITVLCVQVLRRLAGASVYQTGIVTTVLLILCTQLLPSPPEGFYWYNGSIYYTFVFGLSLMMYAGLLAGPAPSPGRTAGRMAWLSLLSFLIGGGNLVTGLLTAIFYGCLLLARALKKDWRALLFLLIPAVFFAAGFLLNILAPGYGFRMDTVADHLSLPGTVLFCLRLAILYIRSWISFPLACLLVLLAPCLYRIAAAAKLSFRWPGLVVAFSYCFLAAGFCPPIYAVNGLPERTADILFYTFVLLLTFDLFYCLGWLHHRLWSTVPVRQGCSPAYLAAAAVIFMAGTALIQWPGFTSALAAIQFANGDAAAYYATFQERLDILQDESITDPVLPEYPVKPYVLFFDDITQDPSDWRNVAMRDYYGKSSVILETQ